MTELYLVHHGIDGQKWGKKNGPPYPLDKSDYSRSELKAIKKYTSGKGELNKKGKKKFESYRIAKSYEKLAKDAYTKASNEAEKEFQKSDNGKRERKLGALEKELRRDEYQSNEKYRKLIDAEEQTKEILRQAQALSYEELQKLSSKSQHYADSIIKNIKLNDEFDFMDWSGEISEDYLFSKDYEKRIK